MIPSERQLKALEVIINQTLTLDPLALQNLKKLAGKSIQIECTEPAINVIINIQTDKLILDSPTTKTQTVTSHLTGDLSAFAKLITAEDKVAAMINGNLRLQGDSQLLIELQTILLTIDLDWEFHLAKLIGDLPAHIIGKVSRESLAWLRASQPIFFRHLQEFIVEEAQLSPTKIEIEQFINSIQHLQENVERFEAKLTSVKQKIQHHEQLLSQNKKTEQKDFN